MEQSEVHAITQEVKNRVNTLFEQYFIPRMEKHLEMRTDEWFVRIVEKKMDEYLAVNRSIGKKVFCSKHPEMEALIFTDGPGEIKKQCVWCIREEAVENFKKMANIMAGAASGR